MKKLQETFIKKLEKIFDKNDLRIIEKWFNLNYRKPSFRINTIKSNETEIKEILEKKWLKISKINFLENWYLLENWREKDLWDLEIFKEWKIYLQQIVSQLPVKFLDLKKWNIVLDITAAPWWKTTQIWAKLNNTGKIFAVDNNSIRIEKLKYTIKRQGIKNVCVIKSDARNIQDEFWNILKKQWWEKDDIFWYFDNILFDAPCSAEWRFNLNKEKTYAFWKPEIPKKNYKLQKQILEKIIPLLKSGWTLIYSTCTLAPEENEAICHFILSNYPELKIQDIDLNYKYARKWIKKFCKQIFRNDVEKSTRIIPSEETQWFFIAKFKKINK